MLQPFGAYAPAPLPTGPSTAGFVLSLVGLVTGSFMPAVTLPVTIVGLVLSAISLKRCRQGLAGGRGLATAGLVLGIIGVVLSVLMAVLLIAALSASGP